MLFFFFVLLLAAAGAEAGASRNVLHIQIDDLRPELGHYGLPNRHTPNLDALAKDAIVFDRAYCQQAVCGPSRNSYLSGRRPDASKSWNFINHFREEHPDWTTLPGLFLRAGAKALASGKTYHPKLPPAYDGAKSWSPEALPYANPCWNSADWTKIKFQDGGLPCVFCPVDIESHLFHKGNTSVANEFCPIDAIEDTLTVEHAIKLLKSAAAGKTPFYLAVGMHKPHIPFQAAQEDFDKHPLDSVQLPKHPLPPKNMPDIAFHFTDENVHPDPWHPIRMDSQRKTRRAYYAAVTGMDRKLGKLIAELDSLGLTNNTAIVVHSDHGWHLGEHGEWRKMTNFELTTRVPMFIRAPWLGKGGRSSALVELVDLLPTIAELAGVPLPPNETFDGVSLVPLLKQPSGKVKDAAFSQYPRQVIDPKKMWYKNGIIHDDRSKFTHMGYSVRTHEWRYTEWVQFNGTTLLPVWGNVTARELYDHRNETVYPTDFDEGENENVAAEPQFASVIQSLSQIIRKQFDK